MLGQVSVDGWPGYSERVGDLLDGVAALVIHRSGLPDLRRRHLELRPTLPAPGAGGREAVVSALHDEVVLELRDRSEHVEEQAATRSGGVDALREGFQPDPSLLQLVRDLFQVPHGPSESVKLRHHERVAIAQIRERIRQRGPLRQCAGCVLDEDLVAAGRLERIGLTVRVLVSSRDSGVTDRGHASV